MPGQYTARLTASGHDYTANFQVTMDPRVKVSEQALKKKFNLEIQLASTMSQSSEAVLQARSVREQLRRIADDDAVKSSARALDAAISALLDGPPDASSQASTLTKVNSNLIALYKEVEKADAEPTPAQSQTVGKTVEPVADLLKRWNDLKSTAMNNLNVRLKASGLPELRPEVRPQEEIGENEE